jgi:hypothetical protein
MFAMHANARNLTLFSDAHHIKHSSSGALCRDVGEHIKQHTARTEHNLHQTKNTRFLRAVTSPS